MKLWLQILLGLAALVTLYYLLCAIVGTLFSLLGVVAVALLLGALLTAWLRKAWRKGQPGKIQARRIERQADRALRDLKKSPPDDLG
jgi:Flp pilus assembly protein TadB